MAAGLPSRGVEIGERSREGDWVREEDVREVNNGEFTDFIAKSISFGCNGGGNGGGGAEEDDDNDDDAPDVGVMMVMVGVPSFGRKVSVTPRTTSSKR